MYMGSERFGGMMFCKNCGKELSDDAKFCPECGTRVSADAGGGTVRPEMEIVREDAAAEKESGKRKESYAKDGVINGKKVTENIYLCPDGVYRWFYKFNMLKNPTILFTVWKVLGISFVIVIGFLLIADLAEGTIHSVSEILPVLKIFGILLSVFFVISIIGYLIVAAMFGWSYVVLFEMTDEYVKHIQAPKQLKKARELNKLTVLAGLMSKTSVTIGSGLLAGAKSSSTSVFKDVEVIRVRRKRDTIHVDQMLDKNQVYAEDADFDFVAEFIKARCVKAKIL